MKWRYTKMALPLVRQHDNSVEARTRSPLAELDRLNRRLATLIDSWARHRELLGNGFAVAADVEETDSAPAAEALKPSSRWFVCSTIGDAAVPAAIGRLHATAPQRATILRKAAAADRIETQLVEALSEIATMESDLEVAVAPTIARFLTRINWEQQLQADVSFAQREI